MPKYQALGAYIFAGGFTEGVRDAGFEVAAHFEDGMYGVDTSLANHGSLSVFTAEWPAGQFKGHVDLVYANPPCAPWSAAGRRVKGGASDYSDGFDPRDDRVRCVFKTFGLLEEVRPRILLFESVYQVWSKGRPLVDRLADEAAEQGYATTVVMHDGYNHGVCQHRRRAFIVFHRVDFLVLASSRDAGPATVRDAWARNDCAAGEAEPGVDCFGIPDRYAELWEKAKPGEKLVHVYNRKWGDDAPRNPKTGHRLGAPGFLWRKIDRDAASPTVTGSAILYHDVYPRTLTVDEQKALCGYPADYEFVGALGMRYKQIAQAVMPPVGRWIALNARRALDANVQVAKPGYRVVDLLSKDGKWEEVIRG